MIECVEIMINRTGMYTDLIVVSLNQVMYNAIFFFL